MIRTKEEIAQRSKLIRAATPDCLEDLFEMQNRICDLCEQPIQDICLSELDHSIAVYSFAKSDLSIDDAISQANSVTNLRVSHGACNAAKNKMSRQEWYERGFNNRENIRFFTEIELEDFRNRAAAGGLIGGANNAAIPGNMAKAGRVSGRKNVESGHLLNIASIGGKIGGRKNADVPGRMKSMSLKQPREAKVLGGLRAGKKNVETGHIHRLGLEYGIKNGLMYGPLGGQKNVETGHIKNLGHTQGKINAESGFLAELRKLYQEERKEGSYKYLHMRWHVSRGIIKEGCKFCESKEQR
jgi:hypothetical protein